MRQVYLWIENAQQTTLLLLVEHAHHQQVVHCSQQGAVTEYKCTLGLESLSYELTEFDIRKWLY